MHFFNDHKINKEVSMKKNIKHFFLLTALAAGTIHFVNRFINMTADIKNILKSENGNFYDWKNGQIYYTRRGSGRAGGPQARPATPAGGRGRSSPSPDSCFLDPASD